ncbi:hypothetical protein EZV62_005528 [Acer yangbiense]|uniref:Derlin n=1 Tax=Acer yangbiense TaxID=1000413 RepID=A0A5C7IML3_9ROSI|nr:hypothetical protein EZV62_005528 [Acer yangbiense]
MSTPAEYYRSLPPVSKFYGVTCLMTTTAYYLQLYSPWYIALSYEDVIKRFQVLAVVPLLWTPFMGSSLVFMILYVWGREYPNARINIYGVVSLKRFSHKVVAFWGEGTQINSPVQRDQHAGVAFRGRGYRLNGNRSTNTEQQQQQQPQTDSTTPQQPNGAGGVAFRGRSHRLDASN